MWAAKLKTYECVGLALTGTSHLIAIIDFFTIHIFALSVLLHVVLVHVLLFLILLLHSTVHLFLALILVII